MLSTLKLRQRIEKAIVSTLVQELLGQGYVLSVFDGEEEHKRTTSHAYIMKDLMTTDDDYLFVWSSQQEPQTARHGWIHFVYGNEGYYVISDYTMSLEGKWPRTDKLVERYENLFS